MIALAIDPGPEKSGFALISRDDGMSIIVLDSGVMENPRLRLKMLYEKENIDRLYVEMIASYGMAVGRSVFDTCLEVGRFIECWGNENTAFLIYRQEVKLCVCHSPKANDANIRKALIDKIGPVGTTKNRGPLYGVKTHAWAALGVGVTGLWKEGPF